MSGLLGTINTTALGAVGFVRSITASIAPQNERYIVWPASTSSGTPAQTTENTSQSSPTQQTATRGLAGYVPIAEEHRDELTITEHPVEQGAAITDHAYKQPSHLTVRIGWSTSMPVNNPLSLGNLTGIPALNALSLPTFAGVWSTASDSAINNTYNTLLRLQTNRTLLTIATARRLYDNMLIESLSLTTDDKTEHALIVSMTLREVILVNTKVIQNAGVNPTNNTDPQNLSPSQPQGQKPPVAAPTPTGQTAEVLRT